MWGNVWGALAEPALGSSQGFQSLILHCPGTLSGMHLGRWQLLRAYRALLQNRPRVPPGPLVEPLGPGLHHGSPRIFPQPVLPSLSVQQRQCCQFPKAPTPSFPTCPRSRRPVGSLVPHFLFFLQDPHTLWCFCTHMPPNLLILKYPYIYHSHPVMFLHTQAGGSSTFPLPVLCTAQTGAQRMPA